MSVNDGSCNLLFFHNNITPYTCCFRQPARSTHFEAARKAFFAFVNQTGRKDSSDEVLDYFRLRKLRKIKKYGLLSNDDLLSLNQYTKRFQNYSCHERNC